MILLRTPNNSTVNPIKLELLLMKSWPSTWRLPKKLVIALLMIDQYTPGLTVVVPTKAAKVPRVVVSREMVIAKAEVTSKAAVTSDCNRICLSSNKTGICLRLLPWYIYPHAMCSPRGLIRGGWCQFTKCQLIGIPSAILGGRTHKFDSAVHVWQEEPWRCKCTWAPLNFPSLDVWVLWDWAS